MACMLCTSFASVVVYWSKWMVDTCGRSGWNVPNRRHLSVIKTIVACAWLSYSKQTVSVAMKWCCSQIGSNFSISTAQQPIIPLWYGAFTNTSTSLFIAMCSTLSTTIHFRVSELRHKSAQPQGHEQTHLSADLGGTWLTSASALSVQQSSYMHTFQPIYEFHSIAAFHLLVPSFIMLLVALLNQAKLIF